MTSYIPHVKRNKYNFAIGFIASHDVVENRSFPLPCESCYLLTHFYNLMLLPSIVVNVREICRRKEIFRFLRKCNLNWSHGTLGKAKA